MRLHTLLASATLAAAAAAAGCRSATDAGPQPAHVIVTPDTLSIPQKGSASLAVQVTDKNDQLISGVAVTFASSNAQMLSASNLGVVTSLGPAGTANVIVRAGRASTTVPVTVTPVSSGIAVTPDPVVVPQKGTVQLQAQVLDAVGTPVPGEAITYTPANGSLISVSSSGLVTSVGPAGQTTILLTSGALSRTINVTVSQVASDLRVTPSTLNLVANGTGRLTATLVDAVGAPMPTSSVTWSSNNQSVATISSSGLVTSVGPLGSATITATSGTFVRTAQVNVVTVAHPAGSILATMPLPGAWGIAVSAGNVMLAPSSGGSSTGRADLPSTGISTINGVGGIAVAFNSSGSTAYVADQNNNRVLAVDLATNGVTVLPGITTQPLAIAVSRDDATLYIGTGGAVVPYDLATRTQGARIATPGTVNAISVNPVQPMIYATSYDAARVTEINTTTNAAGRTFVVDGTAQESVVSPDGSTLYVAREGGDLFVFDLGTGAQTARVTGGGGFGAALTPDGLQIWVTSGGNVNVIDRASLAIVQTIAMPGDARRLAFTRDGTMAVITLNGSSVSFVQ